MSKKLTDKTRKCSACKGTGKEPDDRAIGLVLRYERIAAGVTQRAVAKAMGKFNSYVCALEKGQRAWNPRLIAAYRAALKNITKKGAK